MVGFMSESLVEFKNYVSKSKSFIELKDNCKTKDKEIYLTSFCIAINDKTNKTTSLLESCKKDSLLNCFLQSLQYQLPIDNRKFCYLIPYGDKCSLSLSVYGLMELAKRNEEVLDIGCFIVDESELENLKIIRTENGDRYEFTQTFNKEKKGLGVVVAWIKTINGVRIETYSKEYIEKAKKVAKTKNVWDTWYNEMAKKTALRNLLKMYAFVNVSDALAKEDEQNNEEITEERKEVKAVNDEYADDDIE